ncbi:unnamed protein product, partial [marine sediment metagenome]
MSINVTMRGGSGDMKKDDYDPNKDNKIATAQLEDDVMKKTVYDPDGDEVFVFPQLSYDDFLKLIFEWDGINKWVNVAPQLDSQTSIHSLVVLNGKLYGGTGIGGQLFEWNGSDAWVSVAPQLDGQTSIHSLVVLN